MRDGLEFRERRAWLREAEILGPESPLGGTLAIRRRLPWPINDRVESCDHLVKALDDE